MCASAGPSGSRQSIQIDLYFSCFVLFTLALWPPQRCELNFLNIFIMHVYEYESLTDGSFKMFNVFFSNRNFRAISIIMSVHCCFASARNSIQSECCVLMIFFSRNADDLLNCSENQFDCLFFIYKLKAD